MISKSFTNQRRTVIMMSATPDGHTEYDRFEDLTKCLVKVPKEELNEARKRDQTAEG